MRGTWCRRLAFLLFCLFIAPETPAAAASSVLQASNCQLELGKRTCSTTLTWGAAKADLCLFVTSTATGVKQLMACPRSAATATATWIAEAGHRFDLQTGTSPDSPIVDSKFVKAEVAVLSGSSCQLNPGERRCTSDVSVKITEGSSACIFIHDIASGARKLNWCGTNGSQIKMPWVLETGINLELRQGMEVTSPLVAQLFLKGMRLTLNEPTRGEARSALPLGVLKAPAFGFTASWDGRLLFNPVGVGKTASNLPIYGMSAQVFRPEAVRRDDTNRLVFDKNEPPKPPRETSPAHVFSCPPQFYLSDSTKLGLARLCPPSNNVDKMDGAMHIAVAPDFRPDSTHSFGSNPYHSDEFGTFDPAGSFETYKLVYLQSLNKVGSVSVDNSVSNQFLARSFIQIVIANPRTENAEIFSSKVEGPAQLLRVRRDSLGDPQTPLFNTGDPIYGYEPTMSLDGRLIIFQGNGSKESPKNSKTVGSILYYTFNPNPGDPNGWSQPRSVSEMHWTHGPGNKTVGETKVEIGSSKVKFSSLFPLSERPLLDPEGKPFKKGDFFPGAYPWLSYDSSELYTPMVHLYQAHALRTGYSVIGKLTNWRLRVIDGGMSTSRGTLPPMLPLENDPYINSNSNLSPAEMALNFTKDRYHAASDGSFETVLLAPLMLSSSMWGPQRSQWGASSRPMYPKENLAIPMSPEKRVFTAITSHSMRYVEVPLSEVEDGHYLVALPLTEGVSVSQSTIRRAIEKLADPKLATYKNPAPEIRLNGTRFNPATTTDVSGNGVQAFLRGGAQFPFEHVQALNAWIKDRLIKDFHEGVRGNSVYFPASGSIVTEPIPHLLKRIRDNQAFSLSLWIKPLSGAEQELAVVDNLIRVLRDSEGKVRLTAWVNDTPSELAMPLAVSLPQGFWSHLGIRLQFRKVDIFLNGKLSTSVAVPAGRALRTIAADAVLKLGPGIRSESPSLVPPDKSPESLPKILQLDEVALSDVARSNDEMADAAFMLRLPAPAPTNLGTLSLPPELPPAWASVPNEAKLTAEAIGLGRLLFFDNRLSRNRTVSCASCHSPQSAFTISQRVAPEIFQRKGDRNPPILLNRLFSKAQAWDGAAFSLEAQALMPIQNPLEMDNRIEDVLQFLRNDLNYDRIFRSVYGKPADADSLAGALAAFQRSLVSSNSRGENLAELSEVERRGRALFFGKARCAGCHAGPNLTDESFHNIGLAPLSQDDFGRAQITGRAADVRKFKTPSLRNIGQSAPYFHDGRFTSLRDVLQFYNRGGDLSEGKDFNMKPLGLDAEEMTDLEAFLRTLDGR